MSTRTFEPFAPGDLSDGLRSRMVAGVNGLTMHVLEAGYESGSRPTLILLHGFPELAFCWRRLMPLLARAGYHVIAPDQRGYGRTSPEPVSFEQETDAYSVTNLAGDIVSLAAAMSISRVEAVLGHDFGAIVAGVCALARPDLFHRLALLGTPFTGAPAPGSKQGAPFGKDPIHAALAMLSPPRKHYQLYYSGPQANEDMWRSPQGLKEFLRGYYYQKSADWPCNNPQPLTSWTAEQVSRMPHYYCMPADQDMAQVAAASMPDSSTINECNWLTERDLQLIATEFERTGFQGGLQWYRSAVEGTLQRNLTLFSGLKVSVPTIFVAGRSDWGAYQAPGAVDMVRHRLATREVSIHFIDDAGHWVQQEQPDRLADVLLRFLNQ